METQKTNTNRQFLKDYQAPCFEMNSVNLKFQIFTDHVLVSNTMKLSRLKSGDLELNGVDLKLVSVHLNGHLLAAPDFKIANEVMTISNIEKTADLVIVTKIYPAQNTSLEGLYQTDSNLVTQCEAQGFRKISYFLDRPDVMSSYEVCIEAEKEKYPILLSNGDRIGTQDLGNGRHSVTWKDPHKKPCYLFAMFCGDLGVIRDQFVTKSGRKVNLEVYASHGKQDKCLHAMNSLKKSMRWDEEAFGLEYDLNDFMIVAIDDFNSGAMENKGLNIFNSRLVLADEASATDGDYHSIESVVAHEYFHNWTGNRVTLRDWFQLSLKEGLTVYRDQEFSSDVGDRGVERIQTVDNLKSSQFAEDAGSNAHPVRPDSCLAVDNFFTSTIYEKGAEVIRMMQNIVGKKAFRKGMDLYFARHDGQAVTCDDFSAAILGSNGISEEVFKRWYTQAGTPNVTIHEEYDSSAKKYTLHLKQDCRPTKETSSKLPFYVPLIIGLLNSHGQEMKLNSKDIRINSDGKNLIDFTTSEMSVVFLDVAERPVLSVLREFSAPVNLHWNASREDLIFLASHDSDSFNRWESMQKLARTELLKMIAEIQTNQTAKVSEEILQVYRNIIHDQNMDPSFKELMLNLPDHSQMAQSLVTLDADSMGLAKKVFIKSVGALEPIFLHEQYLSLHEKSKTGLDHKSAGMRALKNKYLRLLIAADAKFEQLAFQQFKETKNMTDKIAAMNVLVACNSNYASETLLSFENEWREDKLVMNKWLAAQAMATDSKALLRIQTLMTSPSFNIKNPNNVYSLLRNFGRNIPVFYSETTKAVDFYCQQIGIIDSFNPQVAARLVEPLNFVGKLNAKMKAEALASVQKLLQNEKLSKNSRELLQTI